LGWLIYPQSGDASPPVYAVDVAAEYPHDQKAFTEGLFYLDNHVYESTGEVGESSIRQVDLKTGQVVKSVELPAPYFGEGIVAWKDQLYQLTWKDRKGFIYNLKDFAPTGTFEYSGEGWSATHNASAIIMSDGTSTLRFLNPETLQVVSTLAVTANGCPISNLNELEWIDGQIYANIWQTNLIARINPTTGAVSSFLDVSALGPRNPDPDTVPNGIAYDAGRKRLFVTGKRWPRLYEIRASRRQIKSDAAAALSQCAKK
jgi:glutaminyl-peptide cyclotransferase